jgi:hypothetical protein
MVRFPSRNCRWRWQGLPGSWATLVSLCPVLRPRQDRGRQANYGASTWPPLVSTTKAPTMRKVSGLDRTALGLAVYASSWRLPDTTQDSLPAAWPSLAGRDFVTRRVAMKGFRVRVSSPFPKLAWRYDTFSGLDPFSGSALRRPLGDRGARNVMSGLRAKPRVGGPGRTVPGPPHPPTPGRLTAARAERKRGRGRGRSQATPKPSSATAEPGKRPTGRANGSESTGDSTPPQPQFSRETAPKPTGSARRRRPGRRGPADPRNAPRFPNHDLTTGEKAGEW